MCSVGREKSRCATWESNSRRLYQFSLLLPFRHQNPYHFSKRRGPHLRPPRPHQQACHTSSPTSTFSTYDKYQSYLASFHWGHICHWSVWWFEVNRCNSRIWPAVWVRPQAEGFKRDNYLPSECFQLRWREVSHRLRLQHICMGEPRSTWAASKGSPSWSFALEKDSRSFFSTKWREQLK